MEELVTKGPKRFGREKEVKVLLEEAEVLGTTEKRAGGQADRWGRVGKRQAFKVGWQWAGRGCEPGSWPQVAQKECDGQRPRVWIAGVGGMVVTAVGWNQVGGWQ